jgi:hypothetical protein
MSKLHLLFAAIVVSLAYSTVHPCSCGTGEPPVEFSLAKAIFIGKMLGATETWERKGQNGIPYQVGAGSVRFSVDEVFKGRVSGEVVVNVASGRGTSCGVYSLSLNEVYLVYAYSSDKNDSVLSTGICTRTAPRNSTYAKKDLDFLRNAPPPGSGGTLQGRVSVEGFSFPGVTVKIRSADNQTISLTTDKEGMFEAKQLKPGKYRVEVEFPNNYASERKSDAVTIEDLGFTRVSFDSYRDGARVSGTLLDQAGQGFTAAHLTLIEKVVGRNAVSYTGNTGEGGAFSFKGVQWGEYVLYLDLRAKEFKDYQRFYYPGTFEIEKATVFKGGVGEKVEGLKFHMPEEFRVVSIEGQVLWADGKPAANVNVDLRCQQMAREDGLIVGFGTTGTLTDEHGKFRIQGLTGAAYWVEAWSEKPTVMHAPPMKLVPTENLRNLSFTLSEKGRGGACWK